MKTIDYQKQANDFAAKYRVKLQILGSECKPYFPSDKQSRYVFKLKLSRCGKSYIFNFGQSVADGSKEPDMYSILARLQKYDIGSFEDFCSDFGYSSDPRRAEKTYKAVCREFSAVERLFGDCMEELQEIC